MSAEGLPNKIQKAEYKILGDFADEYKAWELPSSVILSLGREDNDIDFNEEKARRLSEKHAESFARTWMETDRQRQELNTLYGQYQDHFEEIMDEKGDIINELNQDYFLEELSAEYGAEPTREFNWITKDAVNALNEFYRVITMHTESLSEELTNYDEQIDTPVKIRAEIDPIYIDTVSYNGKEELDFGDTLQTY